MGEKGNQYAKGHGFGRPYGTLRYRTVEELEEGIQDYFTSLRGPIKDNKGNFILEPETGAPVVVDFSRPPTLAGLALALNITTETLRNYSKSDVNDVDNETDKMTYFGAISRAKSICESYLSERTLDREGVQGAKFLLSNNHKGYSEKSEVINKNHDIGSRMTDAELDNQIKALAKVSE